MFKKKLNMVSAAILIIALTSCSFNIDNIKNRFADNSDKPQEMAEPSELGSVANTVIIGMYDLDTFNPLMTKSETVKEAMEFVYEPLFELNEQVQPEPVLAKDYGMSADGKTIVINLRDDVKWHDGEGFSAYDVEYAIGQIRSGKTSYTELLKDVTSCSAENVSTVAVTFNHPVPCAAALFTFPIIKDGTDMEEKMRPVGTGAYSFSGKISTDRYMLNRFDYYYGGKPPIDGIYIDEAPDKEHYMYMCGTGAFDLSTSKTVDLRTYTPKGSVKLNYYTSNKLIYLGINNAKTELSGMNTRLAMSQLIDKEYITSSILYSRAEMTDVPINPSFWLYDGTKAQTDTLSAEGHLRIDAWTDKDTGGYARTIGGSTQTLALELIVDKGSEEKMQIADNIADKFNRYGIKTTVSPLEYNQYIQRVETKNYDIMIGEYKIPATQDISGLMGAGNIFNYNSDEMNMLINQIGMTSDTESLKGLFAQFGEKFTSDIPFVPIAYTKECMMSSPKIENIKSPGEGRFYRDSYEWRLK